MGLTIFGTSNFTAPHAVPEPDQRGTYNLVSTCVLTLSLCIYTSVHLNVPEHHATRATIFLRKMKWVLIGLVAPEFVVYNAWHQRSLAKQALKDLKALEVSCML